MAKTYNLKFNMSDGSVVDAGNIFVPEGPQGPKGDTPKGDELRYTDPMQPGALFKIGVENGKLYFQEVNQ